jgi:hypothetical protein
MDRIVEVNIIYSKEMKEREKKSIEVMKKFLGLVTKKLSSFKRNTKMNVIRIFKILCHVHMHVYIEQNQFK